MKDAIKRLGRSQEFYTPEKCYITELSNSLDDPDLSIARARVAPGITTRWHRLHGTGERYFILEGTGRVEIGDRPPRDVTVGDIVIIPPLCRQRITNTGLSDLIFLALCTPRFRESVYEDVDDSPEA